MTHLHTKSKPPLIKFVEILTIAFSIIELITSVFTGSLALAADAGYFVAPRLSRQPTKGNYYSFGLGRGEVVYEFITGMLLGVLSIWILYSAFRRLFEAPEVLGGWMMTVAVAGVVVNYISIRILSRFEGGIISLPVINRYRVASMCSSGGTVLASIIIILTGWRYADLIFSVLASYVVLGTSYSLLSCSGRVLLEAAPRGLNVEELGRGMASTSGVIEVHDLHVWTITHGSPALMAHVLVGRDEDCHEICRKLERFLASRYDITHTTIQIDHTGEYAASNSRSDSESVTREEFESRLGESRAHASNAESTEDKDANR